MDLETPLPVLIADLAEKEPGRTFIEEIDGPTHTYGDFHDSVRRWADGFAAVGVQAEAVVATMLPNNITSYRCWLGLSWLRAIEVPINPQFLGQTLAYPLNHSRAEVLVIAERFVERLDLLRDSLPHLRTVVVPDATGALPDLPWRVLSGEEFLANGIQASYSTPRYHDTHAVIYTSGTTGPSKGVLQPWVNLHGMAWGMFPDDNPANYDNGAIFTCWPTFHSSGKFGMVAAPMFDLRMVFREGFSLSAFWSDIRKYGCTHAPLLVVSGLLMNEPERADDADNPLVRVGMYPLIPAFRDFERRFGVRVSAGFGNTEVGWAATTSAPADHKVNGRPAPGYHIRIADEFGEALPTGTVGEILVRHDKPWRLNKGYLGMPEATADAWRDGWFHTGDAGRFDEEGNLYFVDRLKDSLRRRGHNISSFEVEAEALAHPDVVEAACVGVPSELAHENDAVKDDDVKVFVVLAEGSTLTGEQLVEFLLPRAPKFMVPRYVEIVPALPKTPTGKVKKVDLRNQVAGPTCYDRGPDRRR
ncbi:ATP-dependent acyl-CoA ligase [Sporichthya brevicatena]|uniref:ATP-dependent acyl-CoA ligase n=1 Tax=Sporichthya brevicatena TaxID=171442 RepID=A0ABN1H4K9_9ACTN